MDLRTPIKIVIADDHPVFRKGLQDVVAAEKRLSVIGEAGDGETAKRLVRELKPDVLLLDLNMPGANGLDIAAWVRGESMPVKIIVLTMHKEESVFNKAMDLGVLGYVLKESATNDILDSIMTVLGGGYYISPTISHYLMNRRAKADELLQRNPGLDDLSPTERSILKLVSESKSSKEIADILYVSVRTVENHRMNICNKLNLHGSNGLLKFALENKSHL